MVRLLAAVGTLVMGLAPCTEAGQPASSNSAVDGIARYTIQEIQVPFDLGEDGREVRTDVLLGDERVDLVLHRHSVRGSRFDVAIHGNAGRRLMESPPAPVTLRGEVEGWFGSRVAASVFRGGLHAAIRRDAGEGDESVWLIEPLRDHVPSANASEHIVYRAMDVVEEAGACGVVGLAPDADFQPAPAGTPIDQPRVVEVACETDHELYLLHGSDPEAMIADIETIVNATNMIFERDALLTFEIVHVEIWATPEDPYTATRAGERFSQLIAHWRANNNGVIFRDNVQMFSGVNLDGNTIGVARVPGMCHPDFAFSLVQRVNINVFLNRIALSAHEWGHNLSAGHCNSLQDCRIMCSVIGGCGGERQSFSPSSIAKILNLIPQRPCLGPAPGITAPFLDGFDGVIRYLIWPEQVQVALGTPPGLSPSPPNAVALQSNAALASADFDLSQPASAMFVSFWVNCNGPGDPLTVEYRDGAGNLQELISVDANVTTGFVPIEVRLPEPALHGGSELRFSTGIVGGRASWLLDDVSVSATCLADVNGDHLLDVFDFLAFQDLFAAGHGRADLDGNGVMSVFDFLVYQDMFARGCQ